MNLLIEFGMIIIFGRRMQSSVLSSYAFIYTSIMLIKLQLPKFIYII